MNQPVKISAAEIIAEASARQRAASDPLVSSWVGASAGSGKTKVLTDRILRLLLPRGDGLPASKPEKILALTFTKAGANEMAIRLSKRLSEWAVKDDSALAADMQNNLLGRPPSEEELQAARTLFARVVDTPGGLNIMTIHSFCQSVLSRFPIEAGLPPGFKPLEEEDAAEMLAEAIRLILSHAVRQPGSPLASAVANISTAVNNDQFERLVRIMAGERNQMRELLSRSFGVDGLYARLCDQLGIVPGRTEQDAFDAFYQAGDTVIFELKEAGRRLSESKGVKDRTSGDNILKFWASAKAARAEYACYRTALLTAKDDTPRAIGKSLQTAYPDLVDTLTSEAERVLAYEDEVKAIQCAQATRDLFLLGDEIISRYEKLKHDAVALDFNDLILRTLGLFRGDYVSPAGREMAPWVLYKLDEGLDHILIDEAQDTNPEQWDVIQTLSQEFFAGMAAKDEEFRTVFVVGDEKQSIFGFQRAAPQKFGDMFSWYEKVIQQAMRTFRPVDINTSFRSVQSILEAVDTVFDGTLAGSGLSHRYIPHIAKREGQAGLVEIWPVFRSTGLSKDEDEEEQSAGWFVPVKVTEAQSGSLRMAHHIGDTIKKWLTESEPLHSHGRPIEPGDILILVRTRNAFVSQLVRALKKRDIPVSGVDRMILSEQLAVQDLCAAAAFALSPNDDLSLACLLKSPFISYSDDHLFSLTREGIPLWHALRKSGDEVVTNWVRALIERGGTEHPYEFFSRLLQEPCPASAVSGLRAVRSRLGIDALDPLDEFLNAALAYEASHIPDLQGFLKWHSEGSNEIKRQLEEAGSAVRIMTVHASKGLQAPIVFLPDTTRTASSIRADEILWPHKTGYSVPAYAPSKKMLSKRLSTARETILAKADEEYRRLLYVAMTRAEERLYIGGYVNKKTDSTVQWYDDIYSALSNHPDIVRIETNIEDKDGTAQPILRLSSEATAEPDKVKAPINKRSKAGVQLPPWALERRPEEPNPPSPLVPSRPSESEPVAASPLAAPDTYRFKRGILTHRLLQLLPDLPLDRRRSAALTFLKRPSHELPDTIVDEILEETMKVLENDDFSAIFGPASLAEIPVSGLLHGTRLISGQIDRLLVTQDEILIIDYKTNRPPPQNVTSVPAVYVRQMSAYADTLRAIYPGRKVRAALLWTDGARLMEVPV